MGHNYFFKKMKKIKRILNNFIGKIVFKIKNNSRRIKIFLPYIETPKKINIGSGNIDLDNTWINTDIDSLNVTKQEDWRKFLHNIKLDNIMAEHVWEHLSEKDAELANINCFNFLKSGGILRVAVPDGFNPDKNYIDYVKPNGYGAGSEDHKILYNYKIMKEKLERIGFKVKLLEYWDESGLFHSVDWTNEAGKIIRSKRYDERNQGGQIKYTSLIVDAIRP